MKYLKVFTDFAGSLELLTDAEVGRLFRAMLKYAESEKEDDLKGNERFVWCTAKGNIDLQREQYNKICDINRKNGSKRMGANGSEP